MNFLLTHRGKSAIELLKHYDIYKYFTECVTKEYNFERKPNPDALVYLMEKYQFNKGDIIMVGDRKIDIETARNANIQSAYVKFNKMENNLDIANYNITSLRELKDII